MQKDVKLKDKKQSEISKNDNLRKKHARAILKATNSEAYENLKLAERLKKRKYRLKKKQEEKTQSNQPHFHIPSLGSSSNFKCKCTRNRAMSRVESVLPGSPRKRNEVIQNIAKKFNLRIAYQSAKCGRKKNSLSDIRTGATYHTLILAV